MENGIDLSRTKSLVDFDALLGRAIEAVSAKKLSVTHEFDETVAWKFQVGKYVKIIDDDYDEDDMPVFWVGFDWEENENREPSLWLEFDARTCPAKCWEKVNGLVRTSGKYYSEVDLEFAQIYMNAWVHFYLREEYLQQFYGGKTDINTQQEILTGFLNEVAEKI